MTIATKRPIPLSAARLIADELVTQLSPYCDRLEVAGSIRRSKATVSDIELLAIPRIERKPVDLFGERMHELDQLDVRVRGLLAEGRFEPRLGKDGKQAVGLRYKRLLYGDTPLDLFTATESNWGLALLIRTGPAAFSRRLVTPAYQGGMLPFGYRVGDGNRLWLGNTFVATPDEQTVFDIVGMDYIAPEERS